MGICHVAPTPSFDLQRFTDDGTAPHGTRVYPSPSVRRKHRNGWLGIAARPASLLLRDHSAAQGSDLGRPGTRAATPLNNAAPDKPVDAGEARRLAARSGFRAALTCAVRDVGRINPACYS